VEEVAARHKDSSNGLRLAPTSTETYVNTELFDFIVVGSGSGGGALAARLSENGDFKVLCLEAGTKDSRYLWSRPPLGVVYMVDNPVVDWRYESEPNETHANRKIPVPRGKMLGGSSSINAIVYNRGQKLDYDTWSRLGCTGWSYEEVLPYFKKLESTSIGSDEYRGRSGPIKVTESKKLCPFFDLFIAAANSAGIPSNPDYSGAEQEGVAMAQMTCWRGERQSTATSYLKPAANRPNLTIRTGAEATSLILDGKRCVGVRYRKDGQMREARAAREVIVCAGAANTPKLLELSGIGNPAVLRKHGIPVLHELKGVGENLREHFAATMKWKFNRPDISLAKKGRGWRLWLEVLRWVFLRQGLISQGHGSMRVFARSRPELKEPDVMMVVSPYLIELQTGRGRRMSATEGFFMYTHVQRSESQGSIHIRSSDPFAPPSINFSFLEKEYDRKTAVAAVRLARKIAASEPLRSLIAEELAPGPQVQDDDVIIQSIREAGLPTQHIVGTCKMGTDPMAVVDARLRVHGIAGLRIADASIMPTIVSGNTSVPCMMIGEKCAAMVLEDVEIARNATSRKPAHTEHTAVLT
jgi:choline dehydrogenase